MNLMSNNTQTIFSSDVFMNKKLQILGKRIYRLHLREITFAGKATIKVFIFAYIGMQNRVTINEKI